MMLWLTDAAPSAPVALFVGLIENPTPFKGGLLVPVPFLLLQLLAVRPDGTLPLGPLPWPGGVPPGVSLHQQCVIVDGAAIAGHALSNALEATTP